MEELDPCFNIGLGYGGSWYAGTVFGGTPFCQELTSESEPTPPESNVRNLCIIRC